VRSTGEKQVWQANRSGPLARSSHPKQPARAPKQGAQTSTKIGRIP
jgi:hypothetical protein